MEIYNSNPLKDMLVLTIVFITVSLLSLKLRKYFSDIRTLPSAPIALKSSLLWGGVVTIMCLGVLSYELLGSNNAVNVLAIFNSLNYFILVPISAIIGAIYGFVFGWFCRKKNLTLNLFSQSLVGLVVGSFLGIAFSLISAFSFGFSYNPAPGYGAILEIGFLYFFPICLLIFTIVFGLLTPKNLLLDKVKPVTN